MLFLPFDRHVGGTSFSIVKLSAWCLNMDCGNNQQMMLLDAALRCVLVCYVFSDTVDLHALSNNALTTHNPGAGNLLLSISTNSKT